MTLNLPTWAVVTFAVVLIAFAAAFILFALALCVIAGMDDRPPYLCEAHGEPANPVDFADRDDVEALAVLVSEPSLRIVL
jgi:hypothetical protein